MNAGDAVFVGEELRNGGIYGAIIITLMGVITILSGVVAIQWRHANKVYGYRLQERDTLNNALNESRAAMRDMITAQDERNEITKELGDVIHKQAQTFEILAERVAAQYASMKEEGVRQGMVLSALSESSRQIVAANVEARNHIEAIEKSMPGFLTELHSILNTLPRRTR